jgi:hypothetical protein
MPCNICTSYSLLKRLRHFRSHNTTADIICSKTLRKTLHRALTLLKSLATYFTVGKEGLGYFFSLPQPDRLLGRTQRPVSWVRDRIQRPKKRDAGRSCESTAESSKSLSFAFTFPIIQGHYDVVLGHRDILTFTFNRHKCHRIPRRTLTNLWNVSDSDKIVQPTFRF